MGESQSTQTKLRGGQISENYLVQSHTKYRPASSSETQILYQNTPLLCERHPELRVLSLQYVATPPPNFFASLVRYL